MKGLPPAGKKRPPAADLKKLLGDAAGFHGRGDLQAAERGYRAVLARNPDHFDALQLLGTVLAQTGRAEEAVKLISRALAINPGIAEAHNNLGYALNERGLGAQAIESYRRALALKPDYPDAQRNLGNALMAAMRAEEAVECFRQAAAADPAYARGHFSLGNAWMSVNRPGEALVAFDRALALKPDYAEAHNNRGNALGALHRTEDALAAYRAATAARPGLVEAHNHAGNALLLLRRYEEAIASFEAALALDPAYPYALGMVASCSAHLCDWRRHEELARGLIAGVKAGQAVVEAHALLGYTNDPAVQLAGATAYARHRYPAAAPLWRGERYRHDRIRVAYLSADFHEHATATLIAELIERHDRGRFEVTGISFGPEGRGETRARLKAGFERFVDVRARSHPDVAALLRESEIDIAVDLKGYTQGSRPAILAHRPAPVQVNYLGFPGTMGAEHIDYLITDAFVVPEGQQEHYSEKIVCLPDSFQVNDTKRKIGARVPTRAEAGLPERGFVFCCFNNTYKITPEFFDAWMRLLAAVEGSVLWLLAQDASTMANLRREARARGVAPERLVFAPRVKPEDNLARYRLADLFLDTLPVNAHTTASDALWAGLPVLTCAGMTFAGRVAGSLLRAIGLPELVTTSLKDYEALARRLATEPGSLGATRDRLEANRLTRPLFDIDRFRRHIEAAYRAMWEIAQRGEPPRSFAVESVDPGR